MQETNKSSSPVLFFSNCPSVYLVALQSKLRIRPLVYTIDAKYISSVSWSQLNLLYKLCASKCFRTSVLLNQYIIFY